ncbi:glycosyltransferase family 1 protein [Halomonas sp. CUBES01]|uniref:Glycosyltransferase family 1 protein n=1 Tax=Vreelandella gomseomensis TaxID=370766 RepID=A0ABU1GDJ6_9GAMM|nr:MULTISPECIES: glycosyltransferase family 1 protein [Halomonas]MDR5875153.1 glycosyltransferase family 1 protein [Halomonas gomseomensis]MEC4765984.1 glycosyltransferase family 1 protein [Halomonas sp. CUBES01]
MRLCIVSETWAPEINGVAHTLGRLSRELAHYRVDIDVVRPKPACPAPVPQALAELQVPSWSVPGYREVHLGFCRPATLRTFWQDNRPDIIYLATQGPLGWSARQAARRLGIPLVAGWHTNFDHYCNDYGVPWLAAATRRYLRYFHNGCALTLVPTHLQARQLRQQGIKDVKVMSRGIDGEGFSPAHRDPALRRAWGVNDHQPVALYVGRLAAEKNLALLQETYHAMRNVRPDMAHVIVGDGPARAQLESALPDAHFTGFIDPEALARHYASADLFIFPSLSETWGNVVNEAMASGLAVVAFHHAASAELIKSGYNGITVPVDDPAAFCQAAVTLCQHPADYAKYSRLARLRALEQSWAGIAQQFIDHLQQAQEAYHATPRPCRIRSS